LNLVTKSQDNYIENSQVITTLKFCSDYEKNMLVSLNFPWKETFLLNWKGNNNYKILWKCTI